MRRVLAILCLAAVWVPRPAAAQQEPFGEVEVSFDVGDFDAEAHDWLIEVVEVTGGLTPGQPVTVELRNPTDQVIWSETITYAAPSVRIYLDVRVPVGDVASAGVSHPPIEVAGAGAAAGGLVVQLRWRRIGPARPVDGAGRHRRGHRLPDPDPLGDDAAVDSMIRRLVLLGLAVTVISAASAHAMAVASVDIEARIAGRDVVEADSTDPIRIEPREEVPIEVTIRNSGDRTEEIRYVRIEGKALGLTFLTYDLGVRATLRPGTETTVETALDFFDLDSQATGYLGTSLAVYDQQRRLLGEQRFVIDVRGKAGAHLHARAVRGGGRRHRRLQRHRAAGQHAAAAPAVEPLRPWPPVSPPRHGSRVREDVDQHAQHQRVFEDRVFGVHDRAARERAGR